MLTTIKGNILTCAVHAERRHSKQGASSPLETESHVAARERVLFSRELGSGSVDVVNLVAPTCEGVNDESSWFQQWKTRIARPTG